MVHILYLNVFLCFFVCILTIIDKITNDRSVILNKMIILSWLSELDEF